MEAITVLASFTFLLALIVAGVNIFTFWRKHRVHFKITDKDPPIHHERGGRTRNRDLESAEQDVIQAPAPILHPRLDNLQSPRRWQSYPLGRTNPLQPQVSPTANIFTPFTAATIPENPFERDATPGTVSHFAPATYPRDSQGFPEQKP